MSAHTPGPWKAFRKDKGRWHVSAVNPPAPHSQQVCAMWNHNAITEANARLIAAAPELLEALERLHVQTAILTSALAGDDMTRPEVLVEEARTALQETRAAIAKAKGEAK